MIDCVSSAAQPPFTLRLDILNAILEQQALVAELAGAACVGCGCTENAACMTSQGPCYWDLGVTIVAGMPICSACSAEVRTH
jgi:hypothetical protein